MRRLLSKNPDTGTSQYFVSDPMSGQFRLETVQNVTPHNEAAKASYNSINERSKWGDMAWVARIPLAVYQSLQKQGIANDPKKFKAWLNSNENRVFRTRPGRV